MHWNHRIVDTGINGLEGRLEIVAIYYSDDEKIIMADNVKLTGNTREELQELLEQILEDIKDTPLLPCDVVRREAYAHLNHQEENSNDEA